jgi:hypothetical protein
VSGCWEVIGRGLEVFEGIGVLEESTIELEHLLITIFFIYTKSLRLLQLIDLNVN